MARITVWDLPTRLFHWMLAGGFLAAAGIALLLGDDSPLFPFHAMIGLVLGLLVLLRLVWGFVGTRYARFGSFLFGPRDVLAYFRGAATGTGPRHIGHNPASAWAIFAMLGLVAALGVTGFMLGQGNEGVKDIHEILAYTTLGVVAFHVAGVAMHTLRRRENITASMIHGRKDGEPGDGIGSPRPLVAFVLVAVVAGMGAELLRNYNAANQTTRLPLLGTILTLGEGAEEGGGGNHRENGRREEHEEDDD
jgi:cytochrome b